MSTLRSATSSSCGENAQPNTTSSFASPSRKSLKSLKSLLSPTGASAPAKEDEVELESAEEEEEQVADEEEASTEEEDKDEIIQDLRNKFRDTLRMVRANKEEIDQLKSTIEEQKRFSHTMQKTHTKELALKDSEITDLKRKLSQLKDESDKYRVDTQKEKAKRESTHKAEMEQLRAELRSASTTTKNNAPTGGGMSFSMRSFSMFQSGKSQKMQQKVQADAAERDHARMVTSLKQDLDKTKLALRRSTAEAEEYADCSAQSAMQIRELTQHNEFLETKLREGKQKFKKMQLAVQEKKLQLTEMTHKAGWVAEQLQQANEDLEYERSKHVKQSRLQQVKQVEEIQRLKQENAELKKSTTTTVAAAKPKATEKKQVVEQAAAAAAPAASTVEQVVLLGTETIAELVALKAKQREQRDVKTDAVVRKHKERAKLEQAQAQGEGAIGQMLERLRGCGAADSDSDEQSDEEWI